MVDMLDIVSFVLRVAPDPVGLKENELRTLEIAGRAMALEEIGHIVGTCSHLTSSYLPCSGIVDVFFHIPLYAT